MREVTMGEIMPVPAPNNARISRCAVKDSVHPPAIPPIVYIVSAMARMTFFEMTFTNWPASNPKKIASRAGRVMVCFSNASLTPGKEAPIFPIRGATVSVAIIERNDKESIAARFSFMDDGSCTQF